MVISAHIATDAITELRVRVRLLSTTAEASVLPVRSELAMPGALPVLQHQAPAATASIAAWFCHGRQWPLECANPGIISLLLLLLLIRFAFVMLSYNHPSRL